jgi:hypothetical protein
MKDDSFAKYEAMGFEYIVAPGDGGGTRNVETFTRYASKYHPLGGLLTTWEKSCKFLFESYPIIGFAGRLWAGGDIDRTEDIFTENIKTILGVNDETLVEAVGDLKRLPSLAEGGSSVRSLSMGPITDSERERDCLASAILSAIRRSAGSVRGKLGKDVIGDILVQLDLDQVMRELRSLVQELVTPDASNRKDARIRLRKVIAGLAGIHQRRLEQWKRRRAGLVPQELHASYAKMKEEFNALLHQDGNQAVLSVTFFLPDQYSAQKTAFSIRWRGKDKLESVADGVFKEPRNSDTFYRYDIPIHGRGIPEAVRIETWGYGGQGFSFLEIRTMHGKFVPAAILNIKGNFEHPEHVLDNDQKWCFAGERNTRLAFLNPELAATRHVVDIAMAPESVNQIGWTRRSPAVSARRICSF